jgi:hypothetical protein
MPPFLPLDAIPLDAIPPFDLSILEYSSIISVPHFPFNPLIQLELPSLDASFGMTPSSIAQPLPPQSQPTLSQAPTNTIYNKAQEDVAPQRPNVLSSILIGSNTASKRDSLHPRHMKVPKSILGKRSGQDECDGSNLSLPLSGSDAKRRKLQPSYSFISGSNGTSNKEQIPFSLDSFPTVPTGTFPFPRNTLLGTALVLSPSLDSPLSLSPYLLNGPFYNPQPAKLSLSLDADGLSNPPGYSDFQTSVSQSGDPSTLPIPTAEPPAANATGLLPSKTPPDVPLINIENRSILRRTSSAMPTPMPMHDTTPPFVYEHRANPIRGYQDAMRVMFGTHALTRGERDTIERISREQRKLIIERKVECDAAGGTRRRR